MMGSVERNFLLPILFLLYIVLLLPATVNKLFTKLRIVNNYISVCLLTTVKPFATNSTITLKYILDKINE